jgi:hypothetical protein
MARPEEIGRVPLEGFSLFLTSTVLYRHTNRIIAEAFDLIQSMFAPAYMGRKRWPAALQSLFPFDQKSRSGYIFCFYVYRQKRAVSSHLSRVMNKASSAG